MIGGALAKPVENMPSIFPPGGIFERRPYLLPNLFSAACVFLGVIIGVFFLEETHAKKKLRRDRGVEFGRYLLSHVRCPTIPFIGKSRGKSPEEQSLLGDSDEPLPGYCSTGNFSEGTLQDEAARDSLDLEESGLEQPATGREQIVPTFNKTTIQIIATFGILAL